MGQIRPEPGLTGMPSQNRTSFHRLWRLTSPPMRCNRLAPVKDMVLTACYKMKVNASDCLQYSIYSTGYFELGKANFNSQIIDVSRRPIDYDLGAENKTVITWMRTGRGRAGAAAAAAAASTAVAGTAAKTAASKDESTAPSTSA